MTWAINGITVPPGYQSVIYGGGPPRQLAQIGDPIQGNWIVSVPGVGYITLEDAGHQSGGPGYWAVRINGTQLFWYDGQGNMTITVNQDGSFAMNNGINSWVKTPLPGCNMSMIGGTSFCYCVFSSDAGSSQTINVLAGAPRLSVSVLPAIGFAPASYATLSLSGPNGIVIDSSTPETASLMLAKSQNGLIAAIVDNPAVGTWTATVTATQQLPWYLLGHVHDAGNDLDAAKQAYQANTQCHEILAELGIYVPPPPTTAMGLRDWILCASCQGTYYVLLGILAVAQPEFALYSVLVNLGKVEAANAILQKAKRILQIDDDGTVGVILNTIIAITDPLEWPLRICQIQGNCRTN